MMGSESARPSDTGPRLEPPDEGQRRHFGAHVEALRRYIEQSQPFAFWRSGTSVLQITFFVDDAEYGRLLAEVNRERSPPPRPRFPRRR